MAGVMFGLILHFQYAYGWSPMKAGLANLPIIITMIAATPISEGLGSASATGSPASSAPALLAGSLAGLVLGRRPRVRRDRRLHGR